MDFEKPVIEWEQELDKLRELNENSDLDLTKQIKSFEQQVQEKKKELYSTLKPSQKLQIARHPERPKFLDYVNLMCEDFIELHGDREGTDDRAIIGGMAKIDGRPPRRNGSLDPRLARLQVQGRRKFPRYRPPRTIAP